VTLVLRPSPAVRTGVYTDLNKPKARVLTACYSFQRVRTASSTRPVSLTGSERLASATLPQPVQRLNAATPAPMADSPVRSRDEKRVPLSQE
jgi:hypothetical protein